MIVALTASAMPEDRRMCWDCGMDAVLTKSFTRNELRNVLERNVPQPA